MTFRADPRVDDYIDALPDWQQAICRKVRKLVHAADPEVVETIKRRDRPYFVLDGNICALLAAKDHVNVFIYDPIAPDPEGIITSGQGNKAARTVAIYRGERINEPALTALCRAVIAQGGGADSRARRRSGAGSGREYPSLRSPWMTWPRRRRSTAQPSASSR